MDLGNIEDIYLSGAIDDYVVSIAFPNLHIVTKEGNEFKAPVYSQRMYDLFSSFQASLELYQKVDSLYADFLSSIDNMSEDTAKSVRRSVMMQSDQMPERFRDQTV